MSKDTANVSVDCFKQVLPSEDPASVLYRTYLQVQLVVVERVEAAARAFATSLTYEGNNFSGMHSRRSDVNVIRRHRTNFPPFAKALHSEALASLLQTSGQSNILRNSSPISPSFDVAADLYISLPTLLPSRHSWSTNCQVAPHRSCSDLWKRSSGPRQLQLNDSFTSHTH